MFTKLREYAKAIAALLGAIATFLVTVNAPASWSLYLGSAVALLTGIATFGVPNHKPTAEPTAPADTAITAIQETVQQATNAVSEVDRLKNAASDVLGQIPVLGPLAQQILNSLPKL